MYADPGANSRRGDRPFVVARTPVFEAGAMRQRHARRDAPMLRLVGQVVVPEVLDQWSVEVQAPS
jgi:hypothetical protein